MTAVRRTTVLVTAGLVLLVALVLVLGDDPTVEGRPGPDGVLEVVMEDYRFTPAEFFVPAGEPVSIAFVNRDHVSHHVNFGRGVVEVDGRAAAFEEDLFAGLDVQVHPTGAQVEPGPPYRGFTLLVAGGSTVTVDVTLPPDRVGSWQLGCFTGRGCHFEAGLAASLTVE